MLLDPERLLHTVEQVLKAGEAAQKKTPSQRLPLEFNSLVRECMELARVRHHLQAGDLEYREQNGGGARGMGDPGGLGTPGSYLLPNRVKNSPRRVPIPAEFQSS